MCKMKCFAAPGDMFCLNEQNGISVDIQWSADTV